jgi:thiol-disulfide isomerase/thioredoxin
MRGSTVVFYSLAAALAVGLGVLAAKRLPAPQAAATTAVAAQSAGVQQAAVTSDPSQQHFTLQFVKDPENVPSFTVQSLSGQTLNPAEWRGKVVILNFWATWCGPCRYEIPELMAMEKEYPNSLQVIGLSVDEAPAAEVEQFAQRMGINYPVAIASDALQNKFGGILALPTSFVLNKQGQVVEKHVGLVPSDYYSAEIGYLAGKPENVDVKTFVDEGQVFPANAKNAKSLPGVDMSKLTPAQLKFAMKVLNEKHCHCGCNYTLAQCRLLDSACPVSQKEAQTIVNEIVAGKYPASGPAAKPAVSVRVATPTR